MKKSLVLTFLFLGILIPSQVLALEASSSASSSADLQAKLKTLQDTIASKVAKLKTEINQKLQNKIYLGLIKNISKDNLIIETKSGQKSVTLNEFTEYFGKGGKVAWKNLNKNDFVVSLGDMDDHEVLTAKRVVKLATSSAQTKIYWGQIKQINNKSLSIQTKDKQNLEITTNSETGYYTPNNQGINRAKEINRKELSLDKPIIIVISQDSGNLLARSVFLIGDYFSSKTVLSAASQSAQSKATGSAAGKK